MNREEIERVVVAVVSNYLPRGASVRMDMRLIHDLKLISDDATSVAMDLERYFKVKVPQARWSKVFTVRDLVDVFIEATQAT